MSAASQEPAPLEREIVEMIASDGPMPVERYMALCLAHPRHGYYMRGDPLGRGGDFVTAPEISQIFGELIGVWCAAGWKMMGAPEPLRLIELGPGRGTLMADLVRAAKVMPGFLEATRVHLVETSPALAAVQQRALEHLPVPVAWHAALDEVPHGPALVIANEFFDALPIQQLVRSEEGWHERVVGLDRQGRLTLGAGTEVPPHLLPGWTASAEAGAIAELAPARAACADAVGRRLKEQGGAALIVDYGHVRPACGDTLQAVRKHRKVDVLAAPGTCDITAHVDFEALRSAFARAGAAVHGPVSQGEFLTRMGLNERAAVLRRRGDARQRIAIKRAVERLAGAGQMGHLFKVMAVTHPDLAIPAPFADRPEAAHDA